MKRWGWQASTRIVVISGLLSVVAMVSAALEPFGIDSAIDKQSRDIVYRVFAPWYANTVKAPATTEVFFDNADSWVAPRSSASRTGQVGQDEIVTVYLSEVVLRNIRDVVLGGPEARAAATEEDRRFAGWQSWRPSYEDHAELVTRLSTAWKIRDPVEPLAPGEQPPPDENLAATRPPPAIFFDFIFLETGATDAEQAQFRYFRDTVARLTRHADWFTRGSACQGTWNRLACIKEAGGLPIIFGEAVTGDLPSATPDEQAPAQAELAAVALLAPVSYNGQAGMYPLAVGAGETGAAGFVGGGAREDTRPSPAVLLYLSWCIDNVGRCAWLEPASRDEAARPRAMIEAFRARAQAPLSLVWGSRPPDYFATLERHVTGAVPQLSAIGMLGKRDIPVVPLARTLPDGTVAQYRWSDIRCRSETAESTLALASRLLFYNVIGNSLAELGQPCPYHLEVPFYAFLANLVVEDVARAVFDGRLIVVGARFRNSNDWVNSVVHGRIGGFHVHAMATDNLIQLQDRFIRASEGIPLPFGRLDTSDIMETLVGFLVFLVGGIGQFSLNRRMIAAVDASAGQGPVRRRGHWWLYLATFGTIIFIVIGAMLAQIFIFRLAPLNWIGLAALSVGYFVFVMRDEIGDDVERFLCQLPLVRHPATVSLRWIGKARRYLDMETVGFERKSTLSKARQAKDSVVGDLYNKEINDKLSG